MRQVLIHTDRNQFAANLLRGEAVPLGIRMAKGVVEDSGKLPLRVNLRVISSTAFAMWVLRKVRSIPGNHRIEIDGRIMPMHMPQAIDSIAEALVNSGRSLSTAA